MKSFQPFLFFCAAALALAQTAEAQFTCTTNDGAITITGYTGTLTAVTIPTNINGLPVTSIGADAFYGTSVTSVTIPGSVTDIGEGAFERCFRLTNVTMSYGVIVIGNAAFEGCALTGVRIPDSVTSIGQYAFSDDHLTNLIIPASVTNIEDWAFAGCQLFDVFFEGNAPTVSPEAFTVDSSLTFYYLAGTSGWSNTLAGARVWPAPTQQYEFTFTTNNGTIIITGYNGTASVVSVPGWINGLSVAIGDRAFAGLGYGLVNLTIGCGVISIGNYAFDGCFLTNLDLPGEPFETTLQSIGNYAFRGAAVTSVGVPVFVTNIGDYAFADCPNLSAVTIFESVTRIGEGAFSACASPASVYFRGSAPSADTSVFTGDTNATVYYLAGQSGWSNTFAGVPAVAIPSQFHFTSTSINGARTITGYSGTNASVVIPPCFSMDGLPITAIGADAFSHCTSLCAITIPACITSVQQASFAYCTHLMDVYFMGNAPTAAPDAFAGDNNLTFHNLDGTTGWSNTFAGRPAVTTPTPQSEFTYATNNGTITITGYNGPSPVVTIPTKINGLPVTAIGDWAFAELGAGLVSVTIPGSVTSIGQRAFSSDGLTNLTIPASITNIGDYAFASCPYLPSVVFQGNAPVADTTVFNNPVTVYYWIGTTGWSNTFAGYPAVGTTPPTQFTYATTNGAITINGYTGTEGNLGIPSTINGLPVTAIGEYAFAGNASLTNVTIADGITSIGQLAFESDRLTSVRIPGSVTSIGGNAFFGCPNLTNAIIGIGVTNIGQTAFGGCPRLTAITVDSRDAFYSSLNGVLFDKNQTVLLAYPGGLGGNYAIPATVGNIGVLAFDMCSNLTGVTIPASVTNLGGYAFLDCSDLISVTIPSSVTAVGYMAFYQCIRLTSATIGVGVTSVGINAFANCANLTSIMFLGNAPAANTTVFNGATNTIVYYESGTTGWSNTFAGRPAVAVPPPQTQFTYTTNNGAITITGYNGASPVVVIPSMINGLPVTAIGDWAFAEFGAHLVSVTIPSSVTSIGQRAFSSDGLTNLTIPASVTNIGDYAFAWCPYLPSVVFQGNAPVADTTVFNNPVTVYYWIGTTGWSNTFAGVPAVGTPPPTQFTYATTNGAITINGYTGHEGNLGIPPTINGVPVTALGTFAISDNASLTNVTIPASITSIGEAAFFNCASLTSVTIPGSVTSIGEETFAVCAGLTNVTIPWSVTNIGACAFLGDPSLQAINVDAQNAFYSSANGVLFTSPEDGLVTLIQYPGGLGGNYTVLLNVGSIGFDAFDDCTNLTGIVIPGSVTNIGVQAFVWCSSLASLTIADSVTSIGDFAFDCCASLTNFTIPNSVTNLGKAAFSDCFCLTSMALPTNLATVPADTFTGCIGLTNVTIPASVTKIGDDSFSDCTSLRGIVIPDRVTSIGDQAFSWCSSLASVTIPGRVTSMGDYAFMGCSSLTNATLLQGATHIGYSAFYGDARLTSVTIPGSVASIADSAFKSCSSLADVTISGGVAGIGAFSFVGCSVLSNITIPASVTSIGDYAFGVCTRLTGVLFLGNAPTADRSVFTNDSSATVYYFGGTAGWSNTYAGVPAVEIADPSQFTYTTNGGTISITGYVVSGGALDIPAYIHGMPVNNIGSNAFKNLGFVSGVTIPGTVTNIAYEAFFGCSNLSSVIIPGSVMSIGRSAFSHCFELTNATFSEGVSSIGYGAFYECSNLTSVVVPGSVTNIGEYAFQHCARLTNVTIGYGMTSIGEYAFFEAGGLASVCIPDSVTNIGTNAFYECGNLLNVTIPASVTTIQQAAFAYCTNLAGVYVAGKPPVVSSDAFYDDGSVRLYYLDVAGGWGSALAGQMPMHWNPQIQSSGASFEMSTNHFGFNITGTANIPIVVEVCTDLGSGVWTALTNVTLTGGLYYFSEPAETGGGRFYRIRSP